MISPKLYAIWPVLFLILPQYLIAVLLVFFATLGDGLLLQGRNKKPSRHTSEGKQREEHGTPRLLLQCSGGVCREGFL